MRVAVAPSLGNKEHGGGILRSCGPTTSPHVAPHRQLDLWVEVGRILFAFTARALDTGHTPCMIACPCMCVCLVHAFASVGGNLLLLWQKWELSLPLQERPEGFSFLPEVTQQICVRIFLKPPLHSRDGASERWMPYSGS